MRFFRLPFLPRQVVVQDLRKVTGFPMILADDLIEASSSVGAMLFFSGMLRRRLERERSGAGSAETEIQDTARSPS